MGASAYRGAYVDRIVGRGLLPLSLAALAVLPLGQTARGDWQGLRTALCSRISLLPISPISTISGLLPGRQGFIVTSKSAERPVMTPGCCSGGLDKTIVFITHDFDEVLRLADRIVMAPATPYVAKFTAQIDRARVVRLSALAVPAAEGGQGDPQRGPVQ